MGVLKEVVLFHKKSLFYLFILHAVSMFMVVIADDKTEKLSVVTESWYPYNYENKQGEIVGSSTDYVKAVLARADIPYSIALYPWYRSFNLARTKKNVLIFSILRTPVREELFHWICPLPGTLTHTLYKLSSRKDIKVEHLEDIAQYSLNVTRGTFPHEFFTQHNILPANKLQLGATNTTSLMMLLKERVDLIVHVKEGMEQVLTENNLPLDTVEAVFTIKDKGNSCMALSKGSDLQWLEKLIKAHEQLLLEYQPDNSPQKID